MSAEPQTWPPELGFLLERHPRSTWPAALTPGVAFWLGVHEHLRRDAAGLDVIGDDYRRGATSARELAVIAAPRLRGLIAGMHGHHQIEDFHYFPAFCRTEPRLASGFERLEREHAELAVDVQSALAALDELMGAAETNDASALALAAQRSVAASGSLCARLRRHLLDEEALVVPLLIEHGDD